MNHQPPTSSVDDLVTTIRAGNHSLLGEDRLRNLARLVASCPPGALVECGVARGGALALMAWARPDDRPVWGFDSFEGMPPLTDRDQGDGAVWVGFAVAGELGSGIVAHTFDELGIAMDGVHVVVGWFEDTFPSTAADVGPISVLRLDCDWYVATRLCLDTFYDQVVPGGAVIIDDYNTFIGCREAVDEFRAERGITAELVVTDPESEVFWIA
jgi:O-methyltransferase